MAGLGRAQEILTEMMEDLGRVRGLPPEEGAGGAAAQIPDSAPGLSETLLIILSPGIALALLLLIMVMVLGRGLGKQGSTGETPVPPGY